MNLSKTQDPFRFLKRRKQNVTPKKISNNSSLEEQYKILPDHLTSLAQSKISKIQEIRSKENHYDPNKYFSQKCQNYLKAIKFNHRELGKYNNQISAKQVVPRLKTAQSNDSLKQILKTKQKEMRRAITINEEEVRQLTFKKLQFQNQSNKVNKEVIKSQQFQDNIDLAIFNEEDYEIVDGTSSVNAERKQCPICGRLFNLAPYEKHIKVCEKVFMKKRKPFSSEKQRSLSKQKKGN